MISKTSGMKNVWSLFDYVFYRIYLFSKLKGDTAPEVNGYLLLSLIQFLTFLNLVIWLRLFYDIYIPSKIVFLSIMTFLAIANWYRYVRKLGIDILERRWEYEDSKLRSIKGWLISLYFVLIIVIPIAFNL